MRKIMTPLEEFYNDIKSHFESNGELAEAVRFSFERFRQKELMNLSDRESLEGMVYSRIEAEHRKYTDSGIDWKLTATKKIVSSLFGNQKN